MASPANVATVLIVEDDDAAAELVGRELARQGMSVVTTRRVSDAVRLLQKRSFTAILLDYQLPGGDPWAVVDVAASVHPPIPVILVTGQSSETIVAEAFRRGVVDNVIKSGPYWQKLPAVLYRVMKAALQKTKSHDD